MYFYEKVLVRQNFVLTYRLIFDNWNICLIVHIQWKVFMQFYIDKSHSLSTPMIMRSLDINDDLVWSQKKDEEFLGDKTSYLGAIKALVHLTNNISPDICFAVNLLSRFSFSPIKGHWNGVEHMIDYPRRTIVMCIFYFEESKRIDWLCRCRIFIWSA